MNEMSLSKKLLRILTDQTILVVLVGLVIVFSILNADRFLSPENIHNVARQVSFDTIVALGQVVVLIAGGVDLSVGSVFAMAAALTMGLQSYGVGTAVLAAIGMGLVVGTINGLLVTKGKIVPFIATLGTMTVVYGAMLTYTQQQPIPGQVEWFKVLGAGSVGPVPIPTIIMALFVGVFHVLLKYTRFGRNLYAVGGNKNAARLAGIQADRPVFWSFVLSGLLTAVSGVLLASRLNSSTIHMGQQTGLLVIAACIMGGASMLGGRGSAIGAFLGILALAILTNGLNLLSVFSFYQTGIRALLLIGIVAVDAFYATTVRKRMMEASAIGAQQSQESAGSGG